MMPARSDSLFILYLYLFSFALADNKAIKLPFSLPLTAFTMHNSLACEHEQRCRGRRACDRTCPKVDGFGDDVRNTLPFLLLLLLLFFLKDDDDCS